MKTETKKTFVHNTWAFVCISRPPHTRPHPHATAPCVRVCSHGPRPADRGARRISDGPRSACACSRLSSTRHGPHRGLRVRGRRRLHVWRVARGERGGKPVRWRRRPSQLRRSPPPPSRLPASCPPTEHTKRDSHTHSPPSPLHTLHTATPATGRPPRPPPSIAPWRRPNRLHQRCVCVCV